MTDYNVVGMRVTPERIEDFLEAHRAIDRDTFAGMRSVAIIQTGGPDRRVGQHGRDRCRAADDDRALDRSREMLEDLGGDLGVTNPVSGEVVLEVHRQIA